MSSHRIPSNTNNTEHEHVNRAHIIDLISQTETWAEQLRSQFKAGNAYQLEELFQYHSVRGKCYLQDHLIQRYFLDEKTEGKKIKGIYVLASEKEGVIQPIYVGISRDILVRLKNHGWGKTNFQSTLLKKMFQAESDNNRDLKLKSIQNCYVYIIPIASDYDLYIQEAMLAGLLKTEWNTFRTH